MNRQRRVVDELLHRQVDGPDRLPVAAAGRPSFVLTRHHNHLAVADIFARLRRAVVALAQAEQVEDAVSAPEGDSSCALLCAGRAGVRPV